MGWRGCQARSEYRVGGSGTRHRRVIADARRVTGTGKARHDRAREGNTHEVPTEKGTGTGCRPSTRGPSDGAAASEPAAVATEDSQAATTPNRFGVTGERRRGDTNAVENFVAPQKRQNATVWQPHQTASALRTLSGTA